MGNPPRRLRGAPLRRSMASIFHAATELIVLIMTLFIVRSEHRDTQAIHAKLDEILKAQGRGSEEITTLDHREPEEIERHREERG